MPAKDVKFDESARLALLQGADVLAGETDAVVMVSAPESPILQMFLRMPGIRLYEFTQADAYVRRTFKIAPISVMGPALGIQARQQYEQAR